MAWPPAFALMAAILHLPSRAVGLSTKSNTAKENLEQYSFSQFVKDYERSYTDSQDYSYRESLFQQNMQQLRDRHSQNVRLGRSWSVGVHPFMDWTDAERKTLNGYKPSRKNGRGQSIVTLQTRAKGTAGRASLQDSSKVLSNSSYKAAVSGPGMRNQGNCGSCWAISAVEAVEAQLQRNGMAGAQTRIAAQALVDCVPNPQHCGGTGGCDGATGELAYAFMRDYGIPLESDLPYTAKTGTCPVSLNGPWPSSKRVRVSGWSQLPSNKAEPVRQALQNGPVVIAVDANNWFDYSGGIFDGCDKDAILGHAVLLKGYGNEGGHKYWQIQNSWGPGWGENGHIRMVMHDEEESWCGVDRKPQEGLGCDGGPPEVTVCGTCGLLYDPIQPQGVEIQNSDASSSIEASKVVEVVDATSKDSHVGLVTTGVTQDAPRSMDDIINELSRS